MSAGTRRRSAPFGGPSFSRSHPGEVGEALVPPHRIAAYVRTLPLHSLGEWLAELDMVADVGWFPCPRCQRTTGQQIMCGPCAVADPNGLRWRCSGCGTSGTHEGLVTAVLHRPDAVERIAAHLAESDL